MLRTSQNQCKTRFSYTFSTAAQYTEQTRADKVRLPCCAQLRIQIISTVLHKTTKLKSGKCFHRSMAILRHLRCLASLAVIILPEFLCFSLQSRTDFIKTNRLVDGEIEHDVLFAVKPRNMNVLLEILQKVSDPKSRSYGKFKTHEEVAQIYSNMEGVRAIESYFTLNSVQILHTTLYGDFISARASLSKWETILSTKFYAYRHVSAEYPPIYRAINYTLDHMIEEHISAVFHVVNFPTRTLRRFSTDIGDVKLTSSSAGIVTPALLNSWYSIKGNNGSSLISQSVYAAFNQYFSSKDLSAFLQLYGISAQTVASDPSGRNNPSYCAQNPNSCSETNLDLEYIMSIAQNTPTKLLYENS